MSYHSEITPVILLDEAISQYLFAFDIFHSRYKDRAEDDPISVAESGHAKIAVLLLGASLEGYINRIIYLNANRLAEPDTTYGSALYDRIEYLLRKAPVDQAQLPAETFIQEVDDEIGEFLAMRNAIAHSHIYESNRNDRRQISAVQVSILKQDSYWQRIVNKTDRFRTNLHRYNTVPSEICFQDVRKSLLLWNKIYTEMMRLYGNPSAFISTSPYPHSFVCFKRNDASIKNRVDDYCRGDGDLMNWVEYADHFGSPIHSNTEETLQ